MDLEKHQTALRAERRALIETLRRDRETVAPRRADPAAAAQRQLRLLERALRRIETGAFGVCMACGANISPQRLHDHPTTALCAFCKGEG